MSANCSGTHNSIGDSGSNSAADAAAGHIAVQVADASAGCRGCTLAEGASSGSAEAQQQSVSDSVPSDMGHLPASLNDSLLAADCLTDAGSTIGCVLRACAYFQHVLEPCLTGTLGTAC
jgi:hypothetical protein